MISIKLASDQVRWFEKSKIEAAAAAALSQTTRWLARESKKRIGRTLKMRQKPLNKRVYIRRPQAKYSGSQTMRGHFWIGLNEISLASMRDFSESKTGVTSGGNYYRGAFARSFNNSPSLIWERTKNRPRVSNPYGKRSPNGTRKHRKAMPVRRVDEEVEDGAQREVLLLEAELQDVFKEYFLDEIHK